jgi:hypothetical protein
MTVEELIDRLMEFPKDALVYVPDFRSAEDDLVTNVILTYKGVLIDYL